MTVSALRPLFTAADSGLFDLPPDLAAHRAAADELLRHYRADSEPVSPHDALVAATVEAAVNGTALPKIKPLIDHDVAVREAQVRRAVLREAVDLVARQFEGLVHRSAYDLVTDTLRPALERVLTETRTLLADLPETLTADALLAAGVDHTAWRRVNELSAAYSHLRRAYLCLPLRADIEHDELGEFSEIKNRADIDPTVRRQHKNMRGSTVPPWPNTEPQRLAWLLRNGAELWLPLPEDQDAAWLVVHGARLDTVARGRADVEFARALGGVA